MERDKVHGESVKGPMPDERCLPKLCGADIELGNIITGKDHPADTCAQASRALLREIQGTRHTQRVQTRCNCPSCREARQAERSDWAETDTEYRWSGYNPQDWGRKFLAANGGCAYIDSNHVEVCLPEVRSAYDHVAATRAMLIIVREALDRANAKLPRGQKIHVLVNNSDGHGNSYGSHLNFLITRRTFDNIFEQKMHPTLFLASHLTSSILFTGQGKVGSENGRPAVDFQLSQRADFYETLTGVGTMQRRPIVNSRDESLCGPGWTTDPKEAGCRNMARLHVIFFDNILCPVASLLRVGVTQIVLAMVEQDEVLGELILDDPLQALIAWSHDPSLRAKARLAARVNGHRTAYTALEMQEAILERAARFVAAGRAEGLVPRARDILALWEDTLRKLRQNDVPALAARLDWVLKKCLIERAMRQRGLRWDSQEVKYLDHMYSSLDLDEGLYWPLEASGLVEKVVSEGEIERFVHEPPEDTRAWLRAQILRRARPDMLEDVDWYSIRLRLSDPGDKRGGTSYSYVTLDMHNPLRFTREECEPVIRRARSLEEALRALGDLSGHEKASSGSAPLALPAASPRPASGDEVVDVRDISMTGLNVPTGNHGKGGTENGNAGKKA